MFVLAVFGITWVPRVFTDECLLFLFVLFRAGGKTPDPKLQVRTYVDVMLEQNLSKEEVSGYPLFFFFLNIHRLQSTLDEVVQFESITESISVWQYGSKV